MTKYLLLQACQKRPISVNIINHELPAQAVTKYATWQMTKMFIKNDQNRISVLSYFSHKQQVLGNSSDPLIEKHKNVNCRYIKN